MKELKEIIRVQKEIERLDGTRKKLIDFAIKNKEKELMKLTQKNKQLEEENRRLKSDIANLNQKIKNLTH